jgi:uncharacterized protein YbaR (Trm112 family)
MGVYGEVIFACPECHELIPVQTKAGDPLTSTPEEAVADEDICQDMVEQGAVYCSNCGENFRIILRNVPKLELA